LQSIPYKLYIELTNTYGYTMHVPGSILGAEDTVVNKMDKNPCAHGVDRLAIISVGFIYLFK
jgi:hypothetical protein